MQEVTIRLRFTQPCLGFAKKPVRRGKGVIYRMPRDSQGRIQFLPSWWRENLEFAAKVVGRHGKSAKSVAWAAPVDGPLKEWKRIVTPGNGKKRARYALHEAFRPGTEIRVNAVLPKDIGIDAFTNLLEVMGTYKGISPFRKEGETYGTFDVVSVLPTIRAPRATDAEEHT